MSEPGRSGNRLLDACVALLLATMALYGVVLILQSIWKPLCLLLGVVGIVAALVWYLRARSRPW